MNPARSAVQPGCQIDWLCAAKLGQVLNEQSSKTPETKATESSIHETYKFCNFYNPHAARPRSNCQGP